MNIFNVHHQRTWYKKQKRSNPAVFVITCQATGREYIGATTNSLPKRLQQFKSYKHRGYVANDMAIHGKDSFTIDLLAEARDEEHAAELVRDFIAARQPEYNKYRK